MSATTTATTSLAPTGRRLWTRSRGLLAGLLVLVLGGVGLALLRSGDQHGRLDPRSVDRYGSGAVATLLADRGVDTRVVTTTDEAAAAAVPAAWRAQRGRHMRAVLGAGPGADDRHGSQRPQP